MIEVALVFAKDGSTLLWHDPSGRSSVYIPDSKELWDFLVANRDQIGGIAHTHPWEGEAWFSKTDVTTWSALERGLGIRWVWPVVTFTEVKNYKWIGPGKFDYGLSDSCPPVDVIGLRERSKL